MDWQFDKNCTITTDMDRINREMVFDYLHNEAYWCKNIPYETCMKSLDHSIPFSLFEEKRQVGFARLVSDYSTFAYLGDVFVLPDFRGKGYGKYLVQAVNDWLDHHNIRTSLLLTRDAQSLYSKYDWHHPSDIKRVMRYKKRNPNFYSDLSS